MSSVMPYNPYQGIPGMNFDRPLLPQEQLFASLGGYGTGTDLTFGQNALSTPVTPPAAGRNWLSMDGFVGTPNAPGWGGLAIGAAAGLGNLFMGMKNYGLAKKSFNESKRQFDMNWEAQKNLTNAQLADRQAARQAASPGFFEDTASYMAKYGVK